MLRAIVLGASAELAGELRRHLEDSGQFAVLRSLEQLPPPQELARMLRAYAPQAVFLSADRLREAIELAAAIEESVPGLPVVAFGSHAEPRTLLELMKAGIREFLPQPFELQSALELAHRLREKLAKSPPLLRAYRPGVRLLARQGGRRRIHSGRQHGRGALAPAQQESTTGRF